MRKIARLSAVSSSIAIYLGIIANAFAQTASDSASKGGTGSSLPNAGSTELTYALFIGGALLFVFGTLKLVLSFKAE